MDRPKSEVADGDVLIVGTGRPSRGTDIRRPEVKEGSVFRGRHAIGPCVNNVWLTLG